MGRRCRRRHGEEVQEEAQGRGVGRRHRQEAAALGRAVGVINGREAQCSPGQAFPSTTSTPHSSSQGCLSSLGEDLAQPAECSRCISFPQLRNCQDPSRACRLQAGCVCQTRGWALSKPTQSDLVQTSMPHHCVCTHRYTRAHRHMYTCTHTHMRRASPTGTHMHAYTPTHMHAHTHAESCTHRHTHAQHPQTHVHTGADLHPQALTCICTHSDSCTCACIHTCRQLHPQAHIHTHKHTGVI